MNRNNGHGGQQMRYTDKLRQQYSGMQELSGSELQKRRDKRNRSGIHYEKQTATFRTSISGKEKRRGVSKPPPGVRLG